MNKPQYHVVSFSGGKDSTALLLGMIERGMQVDCILFCDTGLEFPQMYEHIAKVEADIGRAITVVRSELSFEYLMFEHKISRTESSPVVKNYGQVNGYGWAGPKMRWCTSRLKDQPRERFLRELRKQYEIIEYIGIAADETDRLLRKRNQKETSKHPLVEWGMTEADCLNYCYSKGYDWGGLYRYFSRVSCWCCPLQPLSELKTLYMQFPELWQKLKEWEHRTWRKIKQDYSVDELEVRFDLEDEFQRAGLSISNRQFFAELRKRLKNLEVNNGADNNC